MANPLFVPVIVLLLSVGWLVWLSTRLHERLYELRLDVHDIGAQLADMLSDTHDPQPVTWGDEDGEYKFEDEIIYADSGDYTWGPSHGRQD